MSLPLDFHANHFPSPGSALELTMSETSGPKRFASFAMYDRDSRYWRTSQGSLVQVSTSDKFLGIWPKRGSMLNGTCFHRALSARHTHEIDCSFWPTPRASWGKSGWGMGKPNKGRYRQTVIARTQASGGWSPSPEFAEYLMGWPAGASGLRRLDLDRFQRWWSLHGIS